MIQQQTLRKNCPYSELFWSIFSRIWTEYGEILRISPCSVPIQENTDQNNSEYGHFHAVEIEATNLINRKKQKNNERQLSVLLNNISNVKYNIFEKYSA